MSDSLVLTNLAATLWLSGVAWSLQIVQLPILLRGDYPELVRQLALHRGLNSRLMALPMAVEFVTAIVLVVEPPAGASRAILSVAAILSCAIEYSTVWYALIHRKLKRGYDKSAMCRLKNWNAVRTAGWTVRAGLMLWIAAGRMSI